MEQQTQWLDLESLSISELKARQHALTNLHNYPEWDQFRDIIWAQINHRKNAIAFTPCTSMDEALKQEMTKGEISGMYTAMNISELVNEAIGEELTRRQFEENDEEA